MKPYLFTRDGQTLSLSPQGIKVTDVDGSSTLDIVTEVDDLSLAGSVLDALLAGWVAVAD